jgi:DNA-directed RNA polymerase subunit RPC12/RpoP
MALMAPKLKRWKMDSVRDIFIRKSDRMVVTATEFFNSVGPKRTDDDAVLDALVKARLDKLKPAPVRDYKCMKCGELLVRIYPWAVARIDNGEKMICKKCIMKAPPLPR